jgi:hypothetical protein
LKAISQPRVEALCDNFKSFPPKEAMVALVVTDILKILWRPRIVCEDRRRRESQQMKFAIDHRHLRVGTDCYVFSTCPMSFRMTLKLGGDPARNVWNGWRFGRVTLKMRHFTGDIHVILSQD